MDCSESLRTQAYFDEELDASSSLEVERHLEHCPNCRGRLHDLESVRTMLRQIPSEPAPSTLRQRIEFALDREGRAHPTSGPRAQLRQWNWNPFWTGALSGVAGSVAAAMIGFTFIAPLGGDTLLHDLIADQIRSLMASHLIDVVSTDQHTVKPWFSGHADVSPVVADFEQEGYRLIGGRADYLQGQRSAVVVYQHGRHVINVFAWPVSKAVLPTDTTRSGYHLTFWRVGDLEYCAVSDTSWQELHALKQLLQIRAQSG